MKILLANIIFGAAVIIACVRAVVKDNILIKISTCGRRLPAFQSLIVDGIEAKYWPWHAGIHYIRATKSQDNSTKYVCGGTLIDSRTILTAAHCVSDYDEPLNPTVVLVSLGKRSLRESSAAFFRVKMVIPHPNYVSADLKDDIAIVVLSATVTFNNLVQPICLWDSNKLALSEVIGKLGTVIGWGTTRTEKVSDILQEAHMPVIDPWKCLESDRAFFGSFLSDKNFCAGFRDGTGACTGDSGGSLTFEEKGIYFIRGIVSLSKASVKLESTPIICDLNEYVIFTDVAQYLPWITQMLKLSETCEKRVTCDVTPLESSHSFGEGFSCKITLDMTFAERDCKIIIDNYVENEKNKHLTRFAIVGKMEALPDLTDVFEKLENVKYLDIGILNLNSVTRSKLSIARRITKVSFFGDRIETILPDTFDDMSELDHIILSDNRLTSLHRDVFSQLYKLRFLHLSWNQIETLPHGLFRNNVELEKIWIGGNNLKVIETSFHHLSKIVSIDLGSNDCVDECFEYAPNECVKYSNCWGCCASNECGTNLVEFQQKISQQCKI